MFLRNQFANYFGTTTFSRSKMYYLVKVIYEQVQEFSIYIRKVRDR